LRLLLQLTDQLVGLSRQCVDLLCPGVGRKRPVLHDLADLLRDRCDFVPGLLAGDWSRE